MLQHLLRRLVFDVPILNEYAKMPLKVCWHRKVPQSNVHYIIHVRYLYVDCVVVVLLSVVD